MFSCLYTCNGEQGVNELGICRRYDVTFYYGYHINYDLINCEKPRITKW